MLASSATAPEIREQLDLRRERLRALPHDAVTHGEIQGLLDEVDGALARLEAGSFGCCEACHGSVEPDRLAADPLLRYCLDCLTPDQRRDLEADLRRAAAIQAALLPPRRVGTSGWDIHYHYEPAGAVSGDFCDVIPPVSPGRDTWFLLGDVSGKGVAASLLMSNLHAIFRGLMVNGMSLPEVVTTAGRMFADNKPAEHYATVLGGRARADGHVELVSAGQCPPILRQAGTVREVPLRGLPLGLFPHARYRSWTARLEPGDALVLYSDGLTEAHDAVGEAYGAARAVATLEAGPAGDAEATTRAFVEDVARHRAGGPAQDDLTVMTLLRT